MAEAAVSVRKRTNTINRYGTTSTVTTKRITANAAVEEQTRHVRVVETAVRAPDAPAPEDNTVLNQPRRENNNMCTIVEALRALVLEQGREIAQLREARYPCDLLYLITHFKLPPLGAKAGSDLAMNTNAGKIGDRD
jgi:hypothetical protein